MKAYIRYAFPGTLIPGLAVVSVELIWVSEAATNGEPTLLISLKTQPFFVSYSAIVPSVY